MTKKQLALEVIDRLKKEYPDAGCTLDYDEAWKLLVSVRLAAQCTDARVNVVVAGLFEKSFPRSIPFGSCYFRIVHLNFLPHLHIVWICSRGQII